jgi:hypothetical protein
LTVDRRGETLPPVGLKDVTDVVANVVQTGAIVVGGGWAYLKFVRGRTFRNRAEVDVSARAVEGGRLLLAEVTVKNAGLSRIMIDNKDLKLLQLDDLGRDECDPGITVGWGDPRQATMTVQVFDKHDWVEPSETIREEVLIVPPEADSPVAAYQLRLWVARERFLRRDIGWVANTIVPMSENGTGEREDGREPSGAAIRS